MKGGPVPLLSPVPAFSMGVKIHSGGDAAFFCCLEQIILSAYVTFVVSCDRESTYDVHLTDGLC